MRFSPQSLRFMQRIGTARQGVQTRQPKDTNELKKNPYAPSQGPGAYVCAPLPELVPVTGHRRTPDDIGCLAFHRTFQVAIIERSFRDHHHVRITAPAEPASAHPARRLPCPIEPEVGADGDSRSGGHRPHGRRQPRQPCPGPALHQDQVRAAVRATRGASPTTVWAILRHRGDGQHGSASRNRAHVAQAAPAVGVPRSAGGRFRASA